MITMGARVEHYKKVFPKVPASWPYLVEEQGREVIYATWLCGQDYTNKTQLYGAYPKIYVPRVEALFPDRQSVLHCFSGVLPEAEDYWRLDLVNRTGDTLDQGFREGSVYDVVELFGPSAFDLVVADPPYSDDDAVKYDTPMVKRVQAMAALAGVIVKGGHLVWLDTVWPIHSKEQWVTVGRITVIRSTNHRVRLASIFERV
jgi:hypothetical protein